MTAPEEIGGMPRRARLLSAAVLSVCPHPLARPAASGLPMAADDLADIVAVIRPIFADERSLTRWVAIRGALLFLDMACPDEASWRGTRQAMGAAGDVTGIPGSLARHLAEYGRVCEMTMAQVNADPSWAAINEATALDYIAWAAVAMCRTGTDRLARRIPEPGWLDQPGWYADPLWAESERLWDGSDWTERVRSRDGRRWVDATEPLS